eukprot:scaffold139_cov325-Pavlova_lutheri.AAC.71
MRAYDSATTALVPLAPMAMGACSLDEPHPKFLPPMMIGNWVFKAPSATYGSGYSAVGNPHMA